MTAFYPIHYRARARIVLILGLCVCTGGGTATLLYLEVGEGSKISRNALLELKRRLTSIRNKAGENTFLQPRTAKILQNQVNKVGLMQRGVSAMMLGEGEEVAGVEQMSAERGSPNRDEIQELANKVDAMTELLQKLVADKER
eukprot:COSAG05_NODE_898_length_6685_cov_4.419223_8_plen_143_part_00